MGGAGKQALRLHSVGWPHHPIRRPGSGHQHVARRRDRDQRHDVSPHHAGPTLPIHLRRARWAQGNHPPLPLRHARFQIHTLRYAFTLGPGFALRGGLSEPDTHVQCGRRAARKFHTVLDSRHHGLGRPRQRQRRRLPQESDLPAHAALAARRTSVESRGRRRLFSRPLQRPRPRARLLCQHQRAAHGRDRGLRRYLLPAAQPHHRDRWRDRHPARSVQPQQLRGDGRRQRPARKQRPAAHPLRQRAARLPVARARHPKGRARPPRRRARSPRGRQPHLQFPRPRRPRQHHSHRQR